jgi:shikimate kinase
LSEPRRIVLVGFMGAGKTTVGPLLASRLGWGFRDLDAWIEAREGSSVADIFRARGEAGFRALEMDAARDAAALVDHVVAAGGGAFAQPATREILSAGALTVWLRCAFDVLYGRIGGDARRPLVANRATMLAALKSRETSYARADLVVDTTNESPEGVAHRIAEEVGLKRGAAGSSGR